MRKKIKIIFFIAIASAVSLGLLYGYLYLGVLKDRRAVDVLIGQNKAKVVHIGELEKIEGNLKSTLALGNRLRGFFVKEDAIVDFIQEIEGLMKFAKVTGSVDSVTEQSLNDTGSGLQNKSDIALSISATGDWGDVVKFVGLLENLPYKSTIESLGLNSLKEDVPSQALKPSEIQKGWELKVKMYVRTINIPKEKQL